MTRIARAAWRCTDAAATVQRWLDRAAAAVLRTPTMWHADSGGGSVEWRDVPARLLRPARKPVTDG